MDQLSKRARKSIFPFFTANGFSNVEQWLQERPTWQRDSPAIWNPCRACRSCNLFWCEYQSSIYTSSRLQLIGLRLEQLRFPEISLALKRQKADIITYPSAFTVPTGKAHWESLLRARAIETQSYVIAAAQAGPHNGKRRSYGHSMIVNPWGEIVAELGEDHDEPQIATADINLSLVAKIRQEMPLLRRTDLYPEI